jgi:GT2 family glycosyltransferase
VVILTWNDGDLLANAVGSALSRDGVDVAVYVVDNGSEPAAAVADDERLHLLRNEENRGVAAGRNQGVGVGTSSLVCLLDSDAELSPHSLRVLCDTFADSSIGVAVPVFTGQAPEASAGAAPTLRVKLERGLNRRTTYEAPPRDPGAELWDVAFGIGACQVFRRSVFEAVDGLDESIFYGPEDVDFCLRVSEAGWRVVQVAGTEVLHPPRRAFRNPLSRRGLRHLIALIAHLWRHRGQRRTVGGDGRSRDPEAPTSAQ